MLNRLALLQLLHQHTADVCAHSTINLKTDHAEKYPPLSHYSVSLDPQSYTITAIDGSQIYYDRMEGVSCALINIGTASFDYHHDDTPSSFEPSSDPLILFLDTNLPFSSLSPDYINCTRYEKELAAAVSYAQEKKAPDLTLFDGSLLYEHLTCYQSTYKDHFIKRYYDQLDRLYHHRVTYAAYISSPPLSPLLQDLPPGHATRPYPCTIPSWAFYPAHSQPFFFYLNNGTDRARVEIPAFIAHNKEQTEKVAAYILDQCTKAQGYPVSLIEAHEQAVIKEHDRLFFFSYLEQIRHEHGIIKPVAWKKRHKEKPRF